MKTALLSLLSSPGSKLWDSNQQLASVATSFVSLCSVIISCIYKFISSQTWPWAEFLFIYLFYCIESSHLMSICMYICTIHMYMCSPSLQYTFYLYKYWQWRGSIGSDQVYNFWLADVQMNEWMNEKMNGCSRAAEMCKKNIYFCI